MDKWTPEYRLKLIAAIIDKGNGYISYFNLTRIKTLCVMDSKFLEINKDKYEDVTKQETKEKN